MQKVYDEKTKTYIEINPFIQLNTELAKEDAKYDSLNVIVTSELDLKDETILSNYRQLSHIEECFRVTKTEMKSRQIFVWTDKHIFLTYFISLVILKYLKYILGNEISTTRIASALKSLKEVI